MATFCPTPWLPPPAPSPVASFVPVCGAPADDERGGTVTVAARDGRELVGRALGDYDGPLERLLRHDGEHDAYWLDLARP